MSPLIKALVAEHLEITQALNRVKQLGIQSQEGRDTLLAAKKGLLAHLEKEDRLLYPALNRAAQSNESLKRTLAVFAADMNQVSSSALAFFDKYASDSSGIAFAKDFGGLFATLSQRIRKEENILYKKYDEVSG
ncbi:hemerythrin domain-containing protein [Thalassomonas actiniarum]|uniref:Hemerythrin domain-containing protein n=1 Tax=Thalassomonas actiniarum TaxID=485447 RepID=A0AAF0C2P2_9GAMM|nr:hemerythrin domain-containing protein [Thalassomonas actiniarum]WDD98065.1 hemerythrin domain-containing protein [Thalassomonas actiniarum]